MGLLTTKTLWFFFRSARELETASSSRETAAICTTMVPEPVTGAEWVTCGAGEEEATLGGVALYAVVTGADSWAAVGFADAAECVSLAGNCAPAPVCCTAL